MRKTASTALFATAALSAVLAAAPAARAQEQAGPKPGGPSSDTATNVVGELVVTANKRTERLQDVASSVSAVTGAELSRTQTLDLQDLQSKVPGLNVQQGSYGGISNRLILRGLNTGNSGATVATVVDDVPFSLSGTVSVGGSFGTDIDSYDLSRVEVLRGPQGTLYGATAEGGLIKYVTNAPDPTGYHGGLEVGVMGLDHAGDLGESGKGYINIPLLNGTAAFRASGFYETSPGWIDDRLANKNDANSFTRSGARASLLWKPTQDLTIRLTGLTQIKRVDNFDNVTVNGPTSGDPFGLPEGYNFDTFLLQPSHSTAQNINLNVEYDLHWAKLQSITAYGRLNYVFAGDSTLYGYYFPQLGLGNSTLTQFGQYGTKKVSQEFRLTSEPSSMLFGHGFDWQAGLFYTNEDSYGLSHYVTRSYPAGQPTTTVGPAFLPSGGVTSEVFYTNLPSTYEEFATYADLTYHFTSKFDVEAGGRVFHNREKTSTLEGGALFGFPLTQLGIQSGDETSGTFSVAPRYHLNPNALVYARIASGYRPGGPEPIVPGVAAGVLPTSFGSDRTVNYEGGFKGTLFHNMLSVDVAGFYIDWSDVQVTAVYAANGAGYPITQNVGSASSTGVEWSLNLTPIKGLTLTATGSYTDAHLTADAPGIYAVSGDRLPYVSDITSSVSGTYEWAVFGDARAFVGGGWSHIGDRYSDFSYFADLSHQKIPAYDTFEAQAGVRVGHYGIEVYGKNLTDEAGVASYAPQRTVVLPGVPSPSSAYLIRPRTIGVRLTADF